MASPSRLTISVVVPAYNATGYLARVLAPLMDMLRAGDVEEVIVVDDRSTDDTAQMARDLGARVLVAPVNGGPGAARNLASEHAVGDILWFVDSDVIAWPGGPEKIRAAFDEGGVDAVFGSYDDAPGDPHWFSRYKNLLHRYHHQEGRREALTFWAGCGAVRAEAFRKLGGFDVDTYRKPSIEDIELGYRISGAGGRILVVRDLLGKHLKTWTYKNAIHTDIFCRALPWSRLIIAREGLTNDLNIGLSERARAGIAGLFFLSLGLAVFLPGMWLAALALLALAIAVNWHLVRYFRDNGGWAFAMASILYHQIYYVYSSAAFTWCLFEYHVLGRRDRLHVH